MTADRERAIRERLAAATPGRWDWNHRYELHNTKAAIIEVEQIATGAHVLKVAQPDAALIANAPADLAYLLDRVAELTRDLDAARTALAADAPANVFVSEAHSTAQFYIGADTREEAEMATLSVIWDKFDAMVALVAPRNVVRFNIGHLKDVIAALAIISQRAAALADDGEA